MALFLPLFAGMNADACQKEILGIDKQIEKLEKEKQQHILKAREYQKQGDQWEYNTGRIQDGHEAWGKANDERAKAISLQRQIDLLLLRKERIFQFYPQLQKP